MERKLKPWATTSFLHADHNIGEGKISLTKEFLEEDALFRADVLKDWLFDLSKEYERARDEMFSEAEK